MMTSVAVMMTSRVTGPLKRPLDAQYYSILKGCAICDFKKTENILCNRHVIVP